MPSPCLVKEPYDSRTFRSCNAFLRKPEGEYRVELLNSKKGAWEKHRRTWGTAIYELPVRGSTHKDRCILKNDMNNAKLPPCSFKGHRHFGALAEPITLLEGDIDVAEKGASVEFQRIMERDVMGTSLTSGVDHKSAAKLQRDLNNSWNEYGTFSQPHTQACLEYITSLQVPSGKSTMESDYIPHKTAYLYQPLPKGETNSGNIKTPFARETKKQQAKYNGLMKTYYKELHNNASSKENSARNKTGKIRARSTTPTAQAKMAEPTKRSRSAMLRAVTEATSTSEVSCSLAILPGTINDTANTGEHKLTAKITDAIANRQMNLRRSDMAFKYNVPPVQYFLSQTRSTQTDNFLVSGLNPLWPPASKSDNTDKIGYPHLRLPLAINTLANHDADENVQESSTAPHFADKEVQVPAHVPGDKQVHFDPVAAEIETKHVLPSITTMQRSNCVKTDAHRAFHNRHGEDWMPRVWDYNYLLFHLNRRGHKVDSTNALMSCHASHIDGGLIG